MRRALLAGSLFGIAALLSIGTSKTLYGKRLVAPDPAVPTAVALKGSPQAWLGENPGNQGCFSDQVLDFSARLRLRNTGAAALQVKPGDVTLRLDGRTVRVQQAQFVHPLEPPKARQYGPRLPPGGTGELVITARAILPKNRLETVERASLRVPLGKSGTLRLDFPDIQSRPVKPRTHR